eukprot:scaffold16750_cov21-Tisochrysis_lutea.AAC.5
MLVPCSLASTRREVNLGGLCSRTPAFASECMMFILGAPRSWCAAQALNPRVQQCPGNFKTNSPVCTWSLFGGTVASELEKKMTGICQSDGEIPLKDSPAILEGTTLAISGHIYEGKDNECARRMARFPLKSRRPCTFSPPCHHWLASSLQSQVVPDPL